MQQVIGSKNEEAVYNRRRGEDAHHFDPGRLRSKVHGDNWHGMPVTSVQVISNQATFTIKRGPEAAPGRVLEKAWQDSLKAAKDLQEGKETGGIGFYAPDIIIKGNMIDSI